MFGGVLRLLEIAGFLLVILVSLFFGASRIDFVLTPMLAVLVTLTFCDGTRWNGWKKMRRYCYAAYLNHYLIIKILTRIFETDEMPLYVLGIYAMAVVLYSYVFVKVFDLIKRMPCGRKKAGENM